MSRSATSVLGVAAKSISSLGPGVNTGDDDDQMVGQGLCGSIKTVLEQLTDYS